MPAAERGKYLFRIGASALLNDLLMQRMKMRDGYYASPNYVTLD
jgi:deoxyribose-phosphate aldolase